ncbi:MAG: ammonium transporter [Nitrospiraceae bacterium]|nr:ammonium transporter [Nitrospiraceae bacterium]
MKTKRLIIAMALALVVAIAGGVLADSQSAPTGTVPETPAPAAASAAPALQPDPSGANTGGAADVVGASAGAPTAEDLKNLSKSEPLAAKLADVVGHNRIAINIVWTLVAGFLVMFMQAGFAMVETGFTQAKNAGHTMAMNFMVYPLGMLGYWICGFALQMGGVGGVATLSGGTGLLANEFTVHLFGKDFGLFGTTGFFLSGVSYDASIFALFLFQMVFMDTTATIPTGSMAERWNFKSFVIYGFIIGGLIYPLYANWVWGGGWLSQLGKMFGLGHGHVDYAGSSVVHMTGGVAALAGALVIGPRIGKYKDGKVMAIPGHHIPMAIVGTFILAFGWFGFNAGSSLAGTDLRIGVVAVNTMLASAGGAFSAMLYMWFRYGKPDISMIANGMLAGLVAITAPCAFVTAPVAVLIGAIAGILVCVAVFFIERTLKIDDPVGAISVHGVNGAWGVISLGLFADGTYGDGYNGIAGGVKGLFYGGGSQFAAQLIGTATNIIFVFIASYAMFWVLNKTVGLRVPEEIEIEGLDQAEVAVSAYPDFQTRHTHR